MSGQTTAQMAQPVQEQYLVEHDRPITTCVVASRKVKDVLWAGVNTQLAAFTAVGVDQNGSSCHVALL